MDKVKKERSSNLELYRIVLMFLIVAHHYVIGSGLFAQYDYTNITGNMIFLQIFSMFGKTGINGFTLITGYFMVRQNFSIKRFLKPYLEAKFYYIIFYVVFLIMGLHTFSLSGAIRTLFFEIYEVNVDYVGTYIVFFLFTPFLNILANTMSKKQYQCLLLLTLGLYTGYSTFFFHQTYNYLIWMMVMYLLGGYMQLYPHKFFESKKIGLIGTLVSLVLMVGFILFVDFGLSRYGFYEYDYLMSRGNMILALSCALFSFLYFKNLEMKQSLLLNKIAATTFGVLLIHSNSATTRYFWWGLVFKNHLFYNSKFLVLHAFAAVIIVYAISVIVDWARMRWFEKPFFYWLSKKDFFKKLEQKCNIF